MIFPVNIAERLRTKGKTTKKDKVLLTVVIAIIANVLLFIYISPITKGLHIPTFVLILVQLGITSLITILFIRMFVVREKEKIDESDASSQASLNTYYYLRNKDVLEEIEQVPVFEYTDGNFCIGISLYYGANSDRKVDGNKFIIQNLINLCLSNGMTYRTISLPEKFKESIECYNYTQKLSNIEDSNLRDYMVDNLDMILNVSESSSELLRTVVLIKTSSPYQIQNYEMLIRKLRELFTMRINSFRGLSFMNNEDMRAFMRDYYCLEALDLSALKSKDIDASVLSEYVNMIKLVSYDLKTGTHKIVEEIKMRNDVKRV